MTTKKRGRGRPKKTEKPVEKSPVAKYLENSRKQLGIPTDEVILSNNLKLARDLSNEKVDVPKNETVLESDFSIIIDNETHDKGVRFVKKDDDGLAEIILAEHYLEDFEFSEFINGIIIRAARMKADKLTLEIESIRG